jgi:hypothetical protein
VKSRLIELLLSTSLQTECGVSTKQEMMPEAAVSRPDQFKCHSRRESKVSCHETRRTRGWESVSVFAKNTTLPIENPLWTERLIMMCRLPRVTDQQEKLPDDHGGIFLVRFYVDGMSLPSDIIYHLQGSSNRGEH